ncbi:MAG: hypothetical protein KF906_10615 [Actinobacteria bacterium]|nr:hypothetical protein [Actinomycetota bacterium]
MSHIWEVIVIGFRNVQRAPVVRRLDELGASLVEYALMVALIAVVCIGAVTYFGQSNDTGLNRSAECIKAAQDGLALPANCT